MAKAKQAEVVESESGADVPAVHEEHLPAAAVDRPGGMESFDREDIVIPRLRIVPKLSDL